MTFTILMDKDSKECVKAIEEKLSSEEEDAQHVLTMMSFKHYKPPPAVLAIMVFMAMNHEGSTEQPLGFKNDSTVN